MEKIESSKKQTEKEKRMNIIKETIKKSVIYSNESNKPPFSFMRKIINASNIIKFNYLKRCLKSKYPENSKIKLYNKEYDLRNENEIKKFESDLNNIIFCSYRKNYPKQKSYKTNEEYNSDCGWGCMIRSSQMILAKAIYEILIYEKNNIENAIYNTIPLFMDFPFNCDENIPKIFNKYKEKIKEEITKINNENNNNINNNINNENNNNINNNINNNNQIQKIYPPFSIQVICSIGQILNKTCGEWFSDVNMPHIYKIINENMNVFSNFKILPFQSTIIVSKIIKHCFIESNDDKLTEDQYFLYNNKKYIFKNYGLIFVSVRLGISSIESYYYSSIKNLFNCKECIGFIGGKNYSASYFIGCDDINFLYLDPHFAKNGVIPPLNNENIQSYIDKTLFQLPIQKLQPAFTIGFLIKNIDDFKDLYKYMNDNCKIQNPCFFFQEDKMMSNNINSELENNIIKTKDDF